MKGDAVSDAVPITVRAKSDKGGKRKRRKHGRKHRGSQTNLRILGALLGSHIVALAAGAALGVLLFRAGSRH